ncbi:MAG: FitA-like ribbon-helix-helix domain-containing protein [Rhizobium sp.]|jgi:antitoxin FitA|uniref:FitA-like ribbon-helix-helix domain-containing protein n=1 Tax=Rhizobium sp. TaxID=391 RepID=UPI00389A11E9
MSDLLIRNIDLKLKRRLEARARRHGHSLSEEAKALLNRGLAESRHGRPVGTALLEHFGPLRPVELEVPRRDMPIPPSFE